MTNPVENPRRYRAFQTGDEMVTVRRKALNDLIEYAATAKGYWDSEFVCSTAEQESSDREFDAVVQALGLDYLT